MKNKFLFSSIIFVLITALVIVSVPVIPTLAAESIDITYTGTSYGNYHIFSMNANTAIDMKTFQIGYHDDGWYPDVWISTTMTEDGDWHKLEGNRSTDGWGGYSYSGELEYLPAGTIYFKAYQTEKIAKYGDGSMIPDRFYAVVNPYVVMADKQLSPTGIKIGDAHIWKLCAENNVDLSTLQLVYDEGGWCPDIWISTTSSENGIWHALESQDTSGTAKLYTYNGTEQYLPKGTLFLKVRNTGKINSQWHVDDVNPTTFTCDYQAFIGEPKAADKEIIFLKDGGIGNTIYKMNPSKDIDLSSFKITCNVNKNNYGWTPPIYLATSLDSTEWIELDVNKNLPDGLRYYTYTGGKKSLPAGDIYIKLGASGSAVPDHISDASYDYLEYRNLDDGEIAFSYANGVGDVVYRMDSANNINLKDFKLICNVNDNNIGWTPKNIYISKSLASDANWYDLSCTYSDATTTNKGWREYTYSGDDVTLLAGSVYLKIGSSGKTEADFISQSYYTYNEQTTGDMNTDDIIDIRDLVHAKKNFASESLNYNKMIDMDHNGKSEAKDLVLLRKFLLNVFSRSENKMEWKNKLYGDGIHDDYPAIQEMLDSGIELVEIPEAYCYSISKTLKIHSNQTLRFCRNTRIKLLENSNCSMIENVDFSTLAENITVEGGIWDMNHSKQEPNPFHFPGNDGKTFYDRADEIGWTRETATQLVDMYTGMAIRFCRVNNLTVQNLTIENPVTYGMDLAHIDGFTVKNIFCDFTEGSPKKWNMDGVHIEGYCKNGFISNIYGTTHDDAVALTADDFMWGPIENITIDGIHMTNAHSAVRLLSHGAYGVKNIDIKNITGTYYTYCVGLTKYYEDARVGQMENIKIDNVNASISKGTEDVGGGYFPFMWVEAGLHVQGLEISNVTRNQANDVAMAKNVYMLTVDTGALITDMKLNNLLQISHFDTVIPQLALPDTAHVIEQNNIVNRLAQPGE